MRTLYLIRHAQPVQTKKTTCGYREDCPLSDVGRHQAEQLQAWGREKQISAVYTSPLRRAFQTACILSGGTVPVHRVEALQELDTGAWIGLTFEEIQRRYPAEYENRGRHLGTVAPPDGESFVEAGRRMERAIAGVLDTAEGTVAIVAHGGVNRGWLCRLLDQNPDDVMTLPQPWGGISEVQLTGNTRHVLYVGHQPFCCPDMVLIQALWERYKTPRPVREHGAAVAQCALELADQAGHSVDRSLLKAACLLHDMVRSRPNHAKTAAELLKQEGYPELASIVAVHHDLPENAAPEASLLYLADKLVQGTQRVTLEQRFQGKQSRCSTPEGQAAWQSRYRRAYQVIEQFHLTI